MLKMLWPRAPITIEPPPPQLVLHVHVHLVAAVKERPPLGRQGT
jgi:hypothetical protein